MVLALLITAAVALSAAQTPSLRIVVVEGEDAVNIVQQKTAVAPVVEVRDRNDQPVAGAVVRFAIRSGRATFGGPRTLTVTTNAAGRAAVTTLTPTGSGALQIGATATFQGQTAAVTIAQTNVMTVTQAAAAGAGSAGGGGGGSSAGGAAGGAGGGGGGVSATTIGIVGGAAAGGTLVAKEVISGGDGVVTYSGAFSGVSVATGPCTFTQTHTGTVFMDIAIDGNGNVTGVGGISQTRTITQSTCGGPNLQVGSSENDGCCSPEPEVRGTTANMTFSGSHPGGAGTNWTYVFSGAMNGADITGTFSLTVTAPTGPTFNPTFPVTLRPE